MLVKDINKPLRGEQPRSFARHVAKVCKHWHPLTREEAVERNPFYVLRLPRDAHFYACDQLGDDGRCMAYEERPLVCRGYPWYDQPVRDMMLPDASCEFHYDEVMEFVVRRPDL